MLLPGHGHRQRLCLLQVVARVVEPRISDISIERIDDADQPVAPGIYPDSVYTREISSYFKVRLSELHLQPKQVDAAAGACFEHLECHLCHLLSSSPASSTVVTAFAMPDLEAADLQAAIVLMLTLAVASAKGMPAAKEWKAAHPHTMLTASAESSPILLCLQPGRPYMSDDVKRCFRDLLGAGMIESAGVSQVGPGGTCCWLHVVHPVGLRLCRVPGIWQCRAPEPAARGSRAPRSYQHTPSLAQAASDACHLSLTLLLHSDCALSSRP